MQIKHTKISKKSQEPKTQSRVHGLSPRRAQGHQPLHRATHSSGQRLQHSGSSALPLLLSSQGPTFQGEHKGLTPPTNVLTQ